MDNYLLNNAEGYTAYRILDQHIDPQHFLTFSISGFFLPIIPGQLCAPH